MLHGPSKQGSCMSLKKRNMNIPPKGKPGCPSKRDIWISLKGETWISLIDKRENINISQKGTWRWLKSRETCIKLNILISGQTNVTVGLQLDFAHHIMCRVRLAFVKPYWSNLQTLQSSIITYIIKWATGLESLV